MVPSNHIGVAARRLLASGSLGPTAVRGSGIVAVNFLTLYRLAELVGGARLAGQGLVPVSTPLIAAAVRVTLEAEPGYFGRLAHHPATEAAMVAAYKELRDLSTEGLDALGKASRRASDLVRVHRAARSRLGGQFSDEEDLMGAAGAMLSHGGAVVQSLGTVVVYLPQRYSRHAAAFLRAVADKIEVVVLAGTTGDRRADGDVRQSLHRLNLIDPDEMEPPPGRSGSMNSTTVVSPTRTAIVTASDPDDEVRVAVRSVIDEVRRGTPLERMAILFGAQDPYARLVHEQLQAAGISHNGVAVQTLSGRAAGRAILGLLSLGDSDFRREDLFAWLVSAPICHRNRPAPVADWEEISRKAGVVAGRQDWEVLLNTFAKDRLGEAQANSGATEASLRRAERCRREADRARDLGHFVVNLIDTLRAAAQEPSSWTRRVAWARHLLQDLLGSDAVRSSWPEVEALATERLEAALDRLAHLDAVEHPVDLAVFTRALQAELEADPGRLGRMGEGVLVGSVSMGVGLDLDLVLVLGLAEGSFPSPVRDDSLLPDGDRKTTQGELGMRAEGTERQHHDLLATLAGADRHLLCVPRGDLRRSVQRSPSRWVTEIASSLVGKELFGEDLLAKEGPQLGHVASFDAGLRSVEFPATEQEHRLLSLLANPGLNERRHWGWDPVLSAGAEVIAARRSSRFTRYDGNLAGVAVPSPATEVMSATRLERWAECPFAYFAQHLLKVEPVERPEDRIRISPLDLGSLFHEVLERFIIEVLAHPNQIPQPEEPWSPAQRQRLSQIAESVCTRYQEQGLVGRQLFWQRDHKRVKADLERFLGADDLHRAAARTRPVAAEFSFGMGDAALGSVELPLPDGRVVRFRGKADRLDAAEDGVLEVVDYKTGSPRAYEGLSEETPDARGTKLQLPIYAMAARLHQSDPEAMVHSHYWFTSTRDSRRIGYLVTPEVLRRVAATVGRMVAGIEAGVFPHSPPARDTAFPQPCPYCDPDGLGLTVLRSQIERKSTDPSLRLFSDLADGTALGEPTKPRHQRSEVSGG